MNYFIFDIDNFTDAEYEKWFSLMTKEKQEKVSRYKDFERKKCSVAGEMVVKTNIGSTLNTAPETLVILTDKNGKPYIENCDIHFNISHCGNIIAYAFSNEEIGIDIEKIKPVSFSVAKRFFTLDEQKYVFGFVPTNEDFKLFNDSRTFEKFYSIYTLKEAICKKSGIGIKGLKDADALPYLDHSFKEKDFIISLV